MKKLKFLTFIVVILFMSLFNNKSEAKDIEIHATSWNEGIEFQTQVGAYYGSVNSWKNNGWPFNGSKIVYYDSTHPHGYDIKTSPFFPPSTIASYSYLIQNKPFSLYNNSGTTYGYVKDYNNLVTYNTSVNGKNNNVNYKEFARLSRAYTIVERKYNNGDPYYVNIQYNYFPSTYLNYLKQNINMYQAGSNTTSYYFYFSEPIAWRFPEGGYVNSNRSVLEEDGNSYNRNVGLLTAEDCDKSDLYGYESIYSNLASVFGIEGLNRFWK